MAANRVFSCLYCGRNNFFSKHALTRHQRQGLCHERQLAEQLERFPPTSPVYAATFPENSDDDNSSIGAVMLPDPPSPPVKRLRFLRDIKDIPAHDVDIITMQIGPLLSDLNWSEDEEKETASKYDDYTRGFQAYDTDSDASHDSLASDDYSEEDVTFMGNDTHELEENVPFNNGPDESMRDKFREYVNNAKKNFAKLTKEEESAIRILHILKSKNAPMNAYESIMLWHLKQSNQLREHETLGDYSDHIGRKKILTKLARRYNYEGLFPIQKGIELPVSGTKVKLTCHNAKASIVRLLTDPRIEPQDYLLWNHNPLAKPPKDLDYVGDLNTGQAYIQTHAKLITKKGQQLLPIILYCDGTPVSHFHDLEIIQVKIALGIMTRKARLKAHCWACLGYIEKIHEQGGRGRDILIEARHMDTEDGEVLSANDSVQWYETEGVGDKNDQDFHAMMSVILHEFIELQETGFIWDHRDPVKGLTYLNMEYQLFMPFIRADTKEADLLCAKYGQRHSTHQICRKCHIPLQSADNHLAKDKMKTVSEIRKLIEGEDLEGLKRLSQTYLNNAFYEVRFSLGNDHGIHGSCPSELLHAFLLGTFKYIRDIFFEMLGKTSEGARMINALAVLYSRAVARQSDRTVPGASFTKGIQVGKLMAKDFRGVLLIMLIMFRSTKGRRILQKYKTFKETSSLDDWILLTELMLQWESYLNEPRMQLKHVKRLEKKHRFIMYIMRKVAQRNQGMGLKLMKFHAILHIWEDIIQFGVPLEFDTSANESHHKPSKQASRQTQRAADTFNFQTATRLTEYDLLDLGMEEIDNKRVPWNYYDIVAEEEPEVPINYEEERRPETLTGEVRIKLLLDENREVAYDLVTKSKYKRNTQMSRSLLDFLHDLQLKVYGASDHDLLQVWTAHRRDGQIFRGHPNYRGKGPWRDWVWVDWGTWGKLPSHIFCFVVLDENLPTGRNTLYHGGVALKKGTYAVVETAALDSDNDLIRASDLLTPYIKEDVSFAEDGCVAERTFYLADTEAFLDPCCVVPDIGGPSNRYFVLKPRNMWANEFISWLDDPHNLDNMDPLDSVKEDDAVMAGLEEDRPTTAT